jgi:hypothetical protein
MELEMTTLDPREALTPDQLAIVEAGAAALRDNRVRTVEHWLAAGAAWDTLYDGAQHFVSTTKEGRDAWNHAVRQYSRIWRQPEYAPFRRYFVLADT